MEDGHLNEVRTHRRQVVEQRQLLDELIQHFFRRVFELFDGHTISVEFGEPQFGP